MAIILIYFQKEYNSALCTLMGCGSKEAPVDFVSVTSEIIELESGFSAVRYDGDYGLARFLEQQLTNSR